MTTGTIAKFGERWRIFFLGTILSIWIFIIDGMNYALNWEEDTLSEPWAKAVVLISGFIFCVPTLVASFMMLVWVKPKTAAVIIMLSCLICGASRLVATLLGFRDFWQESQLDSTTSGTTDVAIAGLQLFLLFDALHLYRLAAKAESKGYQRIRADDEDDHDDSHQRRSSNRDDVVQISEDSELNSGAMNPFENQNNAYNQL
eukprot:CAMPEP_0202713034 /NCGR_PEP_ID=MMETSP1385-20130828/48723_1 /ASSEMBLY_ACC=CAM_ASM_000861 /TAXON_ID=933848 /ORGANISM="Elphidium margaritaceum" /LENGTH=201 /DNA_ID=CAMNT_0049373259 /DNA_START=48 /DNA_END=653 /DNA_ORIENTATION=+